MKGRKFDQDKPRWSLLPWEELEEVTKVISLGSIKYEDYNWQKVSNAKDRYFSALLRHVTAWWNGQTKDDESNLSHLAHACCCILFLMWFDNLNKRSKDVSRSQKRRKESARNLSIASSKKKRRNSKT